jgi:hypothetical protein
MVAMGHRRKVRTDVTDLAVLAGLCTHIQIRVREPLTPSGQALIDYLGATVIIDPDAPPAPNWNALARSVGWRDVDHPHPRVEPDHPLGIEASHWLDDNRASAFINEKVREALSRDYRRRGGRAA